MLAGAIFFCLTGKKEVLLVQLYIETCLRKMLSLTKQPPILKSKGLYIECKKDIQFWSIFTDLPKEKQNPAVLLTLSTNIRECDWYIDVTGIDWKDDLQLIILNLDKIYLSYENTRAYMAFKEFYSYRSASGTNITDFFVWNEFLYWKLEKFGIALPEGVPAFFLC